MNPGMKCFSREIYIEADDFMEEPPKKFFRLSPGTKYDSRMGTSYVHRS
jgi:glutaminyl-tRNA synthetase